MPPRYARDIPDMSLMTPEDPRPLILHVLHALHIGGMENGLVNLVNHLPASRFRHAIACIEDYSPAFAARITQAGVPLLALHRSRVGVWAMRGALFSLIRRVHPALVHTRNLSGLDALPPARLAGVRCVHSEHGWDVDNLQGEALKPRLLRRLHRPLVTHYIAVSKDLGRYLTRELGVAQSAVTCIHNGVDTTRFHPPRILDRSLLPEALRDPARMIIGTVGRLQAVKDQATLLRAFAALVSSHDGPPPALVVVGEGPLDASLRQLVESLGISAHVLFTGPSDRIPELLRAMEIFVLPSLNEGISNTLLEAMASGLPILATRVGGNVELIDEGVEGSFFAPGDVASLREKLAEYQRAPDLRLRHGHAARLRAERQFSLSGMMDAYADVYERIIQRA